MYGIYCLLLFFVPIILAILPNITNDDLEGDLILNEIDYICKQIFEIIKVIAIVFVLEVLLSNKHGYIYYELMVYKIIYFSIFISMVICINYFSTRYSEFKMSIMIFVDELVGFIKNNFILNLIFIVLIIFFRNYEDLPLALVSSYMFFVLTSVHDKYRTKRKGVVYKGLYKVVQILLNIALVMTFIIIERIMVGYVNKHIVIFHIKDIVWPLTLIFMIIVNSYLPKIEALFNKFKKLKIQNNK